MKNLLIHQLIVLLGISLLSNKIFATAQYPDILIDGKDTVAIFSNPLERYLEKNHKRKFCGEKLTWTSTACYRGYQATWIILNDSLFLLNVRNGCDSKEYFDLKKEFHTDKKVFAKWYTDTIMSPRGELLQYMHDGYGSIFEKEKSYYVNNGNIDSVSISNYLQYDRNKLNPSERLLSDTLKRMVISNLDFNKIKEFPDSLACVLSIRFNESGIIDSISNEYTYNGIDDFEEYIYAVAIESLRNLPPLMKVSHERYHPPEIGIYFDAHCVKYPLDKEYGCRD